MGDELDRGRDSAAVGTDELERRERREPAAERPFDLVAGKRLADDEQPQEDRERRVVGLERAPRRPLREQAARAPQRMDGVRRVARVVEDGPSAGRGRRRRGWRRPGRAVSYASWLQVSSNSIPPSVCVIETVRKTSPNSS